MIWNPDFESLDRAALCALQSERLGRSDRTRDVTYLQRIPCPCGRTTVKMHRVLG